MQNAATNALICINCCCFLAGRRAVIERLVEATQRLTPAQRELLSCFLEQLEAVTVLPASQDSDLG